ncbi:vacuolar ATP synthase subunit A [Perilla frutescens var. frutescens]|nr:vacuolar ATP synthase subunit A [Perilla frutescens var. frutescens]
MRKFFISSAVILLILMHALCNSAVEKLHALVLAECCISIVREEWLIGPNHFPDGHSSLYVDRIMEIESPFRFCYNSWKISGPVVVADGMAEAAMYEVVRVGLDNLIG